MQNKKIKKIESAPKKQKGYFWLALVSVILFVIIIIGLVLFTRDVSKTNYVEANIGNESFELELVDTEATRIKGLSERNELAQNKGMIFDFKEDGNWRIWMYRMRFSIDIAWLDSNKQILFIKNNASPDDFPERYSADVPSRYVIEINSGELERLGVKKGDYVSF